MRAKSELGRLHVVTGPGKGKTSAAFGMALRAAGHGLRVCVIQFMKTGETTGEVIAARMIKGIEVAQFGTGSFIGSSGPSKEDIECARAALRCAAEKLRERSCDLLVLDEVNVAVWYKLLDAREVLEVVSSRGGGVEVVLTGRNAPKEFIESADYVSVIECVKHPFDKGGSARKGVEW